MSIKWSYTADWFKMEVKALHQGEPFILPEAEFNTFQTVFLGFVLQLFNKKHPSPLLNIPKFKFLWFLYLNLNEEQKAQIEKADKAGSDVLDWANRLNACFISDMNAMQDKERRTEYWHSELFIDYVLGLRSSEVGKLSAISRITVLKELFPNGKASMVCETN